MDANEQNHPSLPPNYVSLADLQQRWLKQQEEKRREKEKEQCEPQQPNRDLIGGDDAKQQEKRREKEKEKEKCQLQEPNLGLQDLIGVEDVKEKPQFRNSKNPNLHNRRPVRRYYRDRKGPKEYQLVKNNNPELKQSKIEGAVMVAAEIDGGDGKVIDQVDGEQNSKAERKIKKKKKCKNKKKMQNPATEEQNPAKKGECAEERENQVKGGGEAPFKPAMELEEKLKKLSVKGRLWKTNGKSAKPGTNTECGEERQCAVKGSGEAPLKPAVSDQTVEIEAKFKKMSVNGRGWRSIGRSTAVIERPKRMYRAYGGGEYRGMRKMRNENGLVWVKKGEVPQHTGELKL